MGLREDPEVRRVNRLVGAILRLPAEYIVEGFYELQREAKLVAPAHTARWDRYFSYCIKQWTKTIKPEELSVWRQFTEATSGLESINRKINAMLPRSRPGFWSVVGTLQITFT